MNKNVIVYVGAALIIESKPIFHPQKKDGT